MEPTNQNPDGAVDETNQSNDQMQAQDVSDGTVQGQPQAPEGTDPERPVSEVNQQPAPGSAGPVTSVPTQSAPEQPVEQGNDEASQGESQVAPGGDPETPEVTPDAPQGQVDDSDNA